MIETRKGLVCPGWCGFVADDHNANVRVAGLQAHLLECPRGQLTLELMRQYTQWLLSGTEVRHVDTAHLSDSEVARMLVLRFRDQYVSSPQETG